MNKKNLLWILILSLTVVACLALFLLLKSGGEGTTAVITVDGEEYRRINLADVAEPYDIVISTKYGTNTVHVERGSICVSEADCPDRICVHQGAISSSGVPVVCMPHRLYISIEGGDIDAF